MSYVSNTFLVHSLKGQEKDREVEYSLLCCILKY